MEGQPGEVIWMRPEKAGVGRPAQHTRAEITAVAVAIADRDGLDAMSMRRVGAELGTGAASLYRYLETREDLLDLMTDATGGEYRFAEATGDWLADLTGLGEQARAIMRRHPWLPPLVITRPVLGPNGLRLLEHVLGLLAGHPAGSQAKLEAFGMLTAFTAVYVQNELAGGAAAQQRNASYLQHALASGSYPRLGQLLTAPPVGGPSQSGDEPRPEGAPASGAPPPADSPAPAPVAGSVAATETDRYGDLLTRMLSGLLGPG